MDGQTKCKLVVKQGSQPGQEYEFNQAELTIGRDPTCECSLDEPTISARHARLSYHHAQWWVEDLHSRNGSFLNDEPVRSKVVITSGDSLRCGSIVMIIDIEQDAAGHN